jgi:hypothetical protein
MRCADVDERDAIELDDRGVAFDEVSLRGGAIQLVGWIVA